MLQSVSGQPLPLFVPVGANPALLRLTGEASTDGVRCAPGLPLWDSTATAARSDADASEFQEFNLTPLRGLLQTR